MDIRTNLINTILGTYGWPAKKAIELAEYSTSQLWGILNKSIVSNYGVEGEDLSYTYGDIQNNNVEKFARIIPLVDTTTLHVILADAAAKGQKDIVKLIFDLRNDIDPHNSKPFAEGNPLTFAIEGGNYDIVKLFLEHPKTKIDEFDLEIAISHNHLKIAELLLQTTQFDSDGIKMIIGTHGLSGESLDMISKYYPKEGFSYQLYNHIINDYHTDEDKILKLLEDPRTDPYMYGIEDILIYLAGHGIDKVIKILLEKYGVDPSIDNNIAIKHAADNCLPETVKILLEDPRVDPNVHDVLNYPIMNECFDTVRVLLKDSRIDPSRYLDHISDVMKYLIYVYRPELESNGIRIDFTKNELVEHFEKCYNNYYTILDNQADGSLNARLSQYNLDGLSHLPKKVIKNVLEWYDANWENILQNDLDLPFTQMVYNKNHQRFIKQFNQWADNMLFDKILEKKSNEKCTWDVPSILKYWFTYTILDTRKETRAYIENVRNNYDLFAEYLPNVKYVNDYIDLLELFFFDEIPINQLKDDDRFRKLNIFVHAEASTFPFQTMRSGLFLYNRFVEWINMMKDEGNQNALEAAKETCVINPDGGNWVCFDGMVDTINDQLLKFEQGLVWDATLGEGREAPEAGMQVGRFSDSNVLQNILRNIGPFEVKFLDIFDYYPEGYKNTSFKTDLKERVKDNGILEVAIGRNAVDYRVNKAFDNISEDQLEFLWDILEEFHFETTIENEISKQELTERIGEEFTTMLPHRCEPGDNEKCQRINEKAYCNDRGLCEMKSKRMTVLPGDYENYHKIEDVIGYNKLYKVGKEQFMKAVKECDLKTVKAFVELGVVDLSEIGEEAMKTALKIWSDSTHLHHVCKFMINYLHRRGVDPYIALRFYVLTNDAVNIFGMFHSKLINPASEKTIDILDEGIKQDSLAAVDALLKYDVVVPLSLLYPGREKNQTIKFVGDQVLNRAKGDIDTIKLVIKSGYFNDPKNKLIKKIKSGKVTKHDITIAAESGVDLNEIVYKFLNDINIDILSLLLKHGVDVNNIPIHKSHINFPYEVKRLIDNGYDLTTHGPKDLHYAVVNSLDDLASYLVYKGVKADNETLELIDDHEYCEIRALGPFIRHGREAYDEYVNTKCDPDTSFNTDFWWDGGFEAVDEDDYQNNFEIEEDEDAEYEVARRLDFDDDDDFIAGDYAKDDDDDPFDV